MNRLDDTQISVVIPTCRPQFLQATLSGLSQQTSTHGFTVIVVENGDTKTNTRELVSQFSTELAITYLYDAVANLNRARNLGVRSATTPIVAIIDDDCVPEPNWIQEIFTAHGRYPEAGIIGGRCTLEFLHPPPLWLTGHLREVLSELHWPDGPRRLSRDEWLVGANMSFRRQVFDAVNGFDETVGMKGRAPPQLCCDEIEFCQRIEGGLGLDIIYDPALQVRHLIPSSRVSLQYFESRYYGQGLSNAMIAAKDDTTQEQARKVKCLLAKTYDRRLIRNIERSADQLNEPDRSRFLFVSACCLIALRCGTFNGIRSLFKTEFYLRDHPALSGNIVYDARIVFDEHINMALTYGGHQLWRMVSTDNSEPWSSAVQNLGRELELRNEIENSFMNVSALT